MRRSTGQSEWEQARAVAAAWELAQSWEGQNQIVSVAAKDEKRITIVQASGAFVASCTNRGIAIPTLAKYKTFVKQLKPIAKSRGMSCSINWALPTWTPSTPVHVSREFEQPDARVHVLAVSGPEAVDLRHDSCLLLPVFARLSFEQGKVDSAVEPVLVHDIQAILQPKVFLLEPDDRFVAEALLVTVALAERGGDPVHDLFEIAMRLSIAA
jgi:hypothetical protein